MSKIRKSLLLFLIAFAFAGCDKKNSIDRIEMVVNPSISYIPGDDFADFSLIGGKIKIIYDDHSEIVKDIEKNWYGPINYLENKVNVNYDNKEISAAFEGIKYISTNEELLASQESEYNFFVIKSGNYNVHSLRYNKDIVLLGETDVNVTTTNAQSSQAALLFQSNCSLKNIKFTSTYEDILISAVKFGKIEVENDVPLINKVYLENINTKGGKGINIQAVKNAVLKNIDIDINETTKNVALAVSSGSNVKLLDSKISKGTWGSIAIFGVNDASTQEWYKRKSTIEIKNTAISSAVYIEYFSVNKSAITGLEDWKMDEINDYRIYTQDIQEVISIPGIY